jgi:hypothetical protein
MWFGRSFRSTFGRLSLLNGGEATLAPSAIVGAVVIVAISMRHLRRRGGLIDVNIPTRRLSSTGF